MTLEVALDPGAGWTPPAWCAPPAGRAYSRCPAPRSPWPRPTWGPAGAKTSSTAATGQRPGLPGRAARRVPDDLDLDAPIPLHKVDLERQRQENSEGFLRSILAVAEAGQPLRELLRDGSGHLIIVGSPGTVADTFESSSDRAIDGFNVCSTWSRRASRCSSRRRCRSCRTAGCTGASTRARRSGSISAFPSRAGRHGAAVYSHQHSRKRNALDLQLTGKRAIVTGASQGIGLDTRMPWPPRDKDVVLAARSEDKLEAAAEQVAARSGAIPAGGASGASPTDVTSRCRLGRAGHWSTSRWCTRPGADPQRGPFRRPTWSKSAGS